MNLQFYIRATNGDSIFSLPIELFASDSFITQTHRDHKMYISLIAALVIIALYNLLSFIVLRESSYLALAIHIAAVAAVLHITRPVYDGLDFLHDTDSHFFTAPIYIAVISLLVLCRQLLQTGLHVRRLDKFMLGIIVLSAMLIFITGWISQGTFLPQLMFIIALLLILLVCVIRSFRRDRTARYLLFSFLLIILIVIPSAVINVVAETKWQSNQFYATGIATVLFLLLLSIVQSEKVREWREQRQRAIASLSLIHI